MTVRGYGGPDQLAIETAKDVQRPGPDQLLADVEAAGVNYIDVMRRDGMIKRPLPYTPGLEGVGRVRAADRDIGDIAAGQRIAWVNVPGSYPSQLLVPAAQAIEVPDSLTTEQALLFQALSAQYLVSEGASCGRASGSPGAQHPGQAVPDAFRRHQQPKSMR